MKKFLISDYDGTFHTDDESMKKNIEKVKEFRKSGNIFAIATGRSSSFILMAYTNSNMIIIGFVLFLILYANNSIKLQKVIE